MDCVRRNWDAEVGTEAPDLHKICFADFLDLQSQIVCRASDVCYFFQVCHKL